jgi:hypothetical protein
MGGHDEIGRLSLGAPSRKVTLMFFSQATNKMTFELVIGGVS